MSTHEWGSYEPVGYFSGRIEDAAAREEGRHKPLKLPPPEVLTPHDQKEKAFHPGYAGWPVGKLLYFPLRARAEPLRLIMHYAGMNYTLRTIELSEWPEIKPTTPKGQVPCFVIDEQEEMMPETADIAMYLAQTSGKDGLWPAASADQSAAEAMFVASNTSPLSDLNPLLNWFPKEEAQSKIKPSVDAALKALGKFKLKGDYFGGKVPHYGEFGLWHNVDLLLKVEPNALSKLGKDWAAWYERIADNRDVKAFLQCRPKAGTGSVGKAGSMMATMPLDGDSKPELPTYKTE